MQELQIKKCNVLDLEKLFHLEKTVFGNESYSYLILRQLYDVCGDLFKIAIMPEGETVGYTIGCPKACTLDAWILTLAVLPSYQRQGIGRKLTSSLFNEFKKIEIKKVFLTVKSDNEGAINLYENLGFSFISREENYFGEGSPRNVMQKVLCY